MVGVVENKVELLKKIEANSSPLFFILGPCVIESEAHNLKIAEFLKKLSEKLKFNFIFKSSFDKANRSSIKGFRGVGFKEGLKILSKVRSEFEIPVITDVHESCQVEDVAQVVDVLQIPAFLCRQTDLLVSAGKTGKIIHIKKGQFVAPENMKSLVDKIESVGNHNIWVCERGYSFGYNNYVVDYRNFPIMKRFGKPIVFDATHSVQRPGAQGNCSGGDREFVPCLATSAVAQGIAGIFMEVHDNPEKALCDGPNSIKLSQLEDLLNYLIDLDGFVKLRNFHL
ncbi:3-deoxy-8-phosphooctulonate synthase [Candidatus Babeliales bacterium]|nr:3-deoxy-8-phosphooctulonate synthase [Candidatus Babeliales bacterium]